MVARRASTGTKSDLAFRLGRWRPKEWLEFAPDNLQGFVVLQQGVIDFSQTFKDVGIGGDLLAHLDKGANDVEAHGDSPGAVEDRGGHNGAVLGEGPRQVFSVLSASGL